MQTPRTTTKTTANPNSFPSGKKMVVSMSYLLLLLSVALAAPTAEGLSTMPLRRLSGRFAPKHQPVIINTEAEGLVIPQQQLQKQVSTTKEGSFLKRHPFASAVAITTINAVAADLLTQFVFEKVAQWQYQRTLLFASFGFVFQGCAQYSVVNFVWEKLFPGTKPKAVLSKMAAMNFISDPILFFPCFYIFKEVMAQGSLGLSVVQSALAKYGQNYLQDWRNSWLVWFPGHAVTYGVMPSHKRIPWMAFLSFFYMCVLSLTRGAAGM